nr:MAG TPA: pilus assembly protein [Caudoviricetes sp.]
MVHLPPIGKKLKGVKNRGFCWYTNQLVSRGVFVTHLLP